MRARLKVEEAERLKGNLCLILRWPRDAKKENKRGTIFTNKVAGMLQLAGEGRNSCDSQVNMHGCDGAVGRADQNTRLTADPNWSRRHQAPLSITEESE